MTALQYLTGTGTVKDSDSHQGGFFGHPHHPPHSCGPYMSSVAITVGRVWAV